MKKILAVAAFSVFAIPAFADDSGFYLGVDAGMSNTDNNSVVTVNMPGAATTKTKGVAGIYGGYQFTQNWAVEAKFTGAGENDATLAGAILNTKADAYSLSVVGTLPVSDSFSVYGKVGYANTKTTVTSTVTTYAGTNRSAATYGVGVQYNVSKEVGIRLGYDAYAMAIQDNTAGSATFGKNNYNSSVYTIGAVFKF